VTQTLEGGGISTLTAYAAIPILLVETHNSFVRFHAYQSLLLSAMLGLLHLALLWSSFLSWTLFSFDVFTLAFLAWRAFDDAESLARMNLPFLSELANSWVEEE